jgi:hypothetical protein
MPTSVVANTIAPTSIRLAFIAAHFELMRAPARCRVLPGAPHEGGDPTATAPFRIEIATLLNSVLMFPPSNIRRDMESEALDLASTTASEKGNRPSTQPVSGPSDP